jgi:hypothetical protein
MKFIHPTWPELCRHPHYLEIWIDDSQIPLFEGQIAAPKRMNEIWWCGSGELSTPKGLPLQVFISGKEGLSVQSAGTRLLHILNIDLHLNVRMLLPTDERLLATVAVRRNA